MKLQKNGDTRFYHQADHMLQMNFLYLKGNNGPVGSSIAFGEIIYKWPPALYYMLQINFLYLKGFILFIGTAMGKTLRAVMEELLKGDLVPLSNAEVEQLLLGWMDGLRPELESLFVDMGRACRAAIDAGEPCDFSTLQEVLINRFIYFLLIVVV